MLSPEKLEAFSGRVKLTGAVPRSEALEWMRRFDVFFFPSTCEGSAVAVLEAMGAGLPVLTTPNSGSRIRNGLDGFICRYDEADPFEQHIRRLDDDRDLLRQMGESARQNLLAYDLGAYQARLSDFFDRLVK